MGLFKKFFSTGHVYAGPEPVHGAKKEEYIMEEVYAGPEQMDNLPEKNITPGQTQPQAIMGTVYAGPEYWGGRLPSVAELQAKGIYPLNNASQGHGWFDVVYAAPDAIGSVGIPGKLSTDGTPESTSPSNEADIETTICASCGERVRRGKFCDNCGMVLK